MRLVTTTNTVIDYIINIFAIFAAFLLAFIMVSICIDIVMRYFLTRPMMWVAEVTEYCMIWVTFLGTAWVLKKKGHVIMDLALNKLKPEHQVILNIITSIVGAAVCLVVTWYGIKVILDVIDRELLLATILTPPAYIVFIIIPIGSLLLAIQFVRMVFDFLKQRTPGNTGQTSGNTQQTYIQ
jgi:C4-dicarboxylate transporter DctQ subunit